MGEENKETTDDGPPATDDALLNKEQSVGEKNTDERDQFRTQNSELRTQEMEVHHHTHTGHHKKKWNEYFWEFLMLFLAVFCGFLAENIREHKIENDRTVEFSKSLVQDLQNDTAAISKQNYFASLYISMADSLLELGKTRLEGRNAAKFSFYTRFAYWTGPISWSRATFEQIKNSGSLRYFKNAQLLKKILQYNAVINEIEYESDKNGERGIWLLQSINSVIDPALNKELSKYYLMKLDEMSSETREHFFSAQTASLENKREIINGMLNMVIVQQRNLQIQIDVRWKNAKTLATELISDIKKEYRLE